MAGDLSEKIKKPPRNLNKQASTQGLINSEDDGARTRNLRRDKPVL